MNEFGGRAQQGRLSAQCQREQLNGAGGSTSGVLYLHVWQVGAGCWLGTRLGLRARGLSFPPHGLLRLPLRGLLGASPGMVAGLQELESRENSGYCTPFVVAVEVPEHHLNSILLAS